MALKKNLKNNSKCSLQVDGFYSLKQKNNTMYAAIIRSPASTGKITGITIPDIPDNYFFYTAKDLPGKKYIKENNSVLNIFTEKDVSYKGEPLGIIIGPDSRVVSELKDQVNISFDISSLESALNKVIKNVKRPLVSGELNDLVSSLNELPSLDTVIDSKNSVSTIGKTIGSRIIKTGIYENLTENEARLYLLAPSKLEETYNTIGENQEPQPIEHENTDLLCIHSSFKQKISDPDWEETDGAFAYTESDELHVYVPTKWTSFLLKNLTETTGFPIEKIYIHKTKSYDTSANGLWRTTQLAIQTAIAAILSKKPVKLMLSQDEQSDFMSPDIETLYTFETYITKDGHIKAMNIHVDVNAGISNPFAQEIADRLTIGVCNYYRAPNLNIITTVSTSQNPPTSICIKRVDSTAFFAIENHIQQISREINILPDELRTINLSENITNFPFDISLPDTQATVTNSIKISDFNRKFVSFKLDANERVNKESNPFFALPLRGIGISTAYNASGYFGTTAFTYDPKIEITLEAQEKVTIHTVPVSDIIQSIWKKTVSEILQIPIENIKFDYSFTIQELPSSPGDSYSSMGILSDLIKKCCTDIQKKRFHQPLPITSKKTLSSSLRKAWNKENFTGNPFHTTAFASTVVEVELDSYTYTEKIKGIWITIDCGPLYDMESAKREILLQIQKEMTTLVKGTVIDYNNCVINFIKTTSKAGQIGELVHNTLPAAFSSALSMALATQLSELPCTEETIFELIKKRETEPELEFFDEEPKIIESTTGAEK